MSFSSKSEYAKIVSVIETSDCEVFKNIRDLKKTNFETQGFLINNFLSNSTTVFVDGVQINIFTMVFIYIEYLMENNLASDASRLDTFARTIIMLLTSGNIETNIFEVYFELRKFETYSSSYVYNEIKRLTYCKLVDVFMMAIIIATIMFIGKAIY